MYFLCILPCSDASCVGGVLREIVRWTIKVSWWEMGYRGGVTDSCYRGRELRVTRGRAKDSGGKEQGVMNKVPQHKPTRLQGSSARE